MAFVLINFLLPLRADDLGIGAVGIGFMYTVFTGTMLIVRPFVGYCLDRFGRRWFFTSAFVFYCLAMAVFAQSTTFVDFCIARGLQGVGASLMWVSARTIIADLHDHSLRGLAMGRLTTSSVRGSMLGAVYGFTLLGFLPIAQAWMWAFAGYALFAFIALLWSAFAIEETKKVEQDAGERIDLSAVLSTPLIKIFVVVFLSMFASALIEPIYLLYLRNKFEIGPQLLAAVFLPAGIVFAILPRYSGAWSDRLGRAPLIAMGLAFAGLVSASLPYWPSLWLIALSYILFSVGWAMASPAEDALVADLAPAAVRGSVIGAKEAAGGIGAALGPLVGGYLFETLDQRLAFAVNGAVLLSASALVLIWFGSGRAERS